MNKARLSIIVLVVIVVVTVILLISLLSNLSSVPNDPKMGTWINYNLYWAYTLFVVTAAAAVLFALYQMATDWNSAKGALMGVGFVVIVVVIAYLLSSSELPKFPGVQKFIDNETLTPSVSKWVDTGLYTTYFLLGIAVLSLAMGPVQKLLKR